MSSWASSRKRAGRDNSSSKKIPLELVLLATALLIAGVFTLLVGGL